MADSIDLRISEQEEMPSGIDNITLIVGEDKCRTQIPAYFLLRSGFLDKHSSCTSIQLPDFSLWHVQCYKHFLYSGKILMKEQKTCHLCFKQPGPCGGCFYDKAQERLESLVQLFLVGEEFQDTSFCDAVISALMAEYTDSQVLPGPKLIEIVYEETLKRAPLRRLLLDIFAAYDGDRLVFCEKAGFSKSFLEDLAHKMCRQISKKEAKKRWPGNFSCCEYHQHAPDAECGSRKRKREEASEEHE